MVFSDKRKKWLGIFGVASAILLLTVPFPYFVASAIAGVSIYFIRQMPPGKSGRKLLTVVASIVLTLIVINGLIRGALKVEPSPTAIAADIILRNMR